MNAIVTPVDARPADFALRRRRRRAHLVLLALFLIIVSLWLATSEQVPGAINKDWVAFDNAGWRALSGNWAEIYRASATERWPYLYPPFAIPLTWPLGLLPFWLSYALAVAMIVVGVAYALRLLVRLAPDNAGRGPLYVSAALLSPWMIQTIVTGQYSWIYLVGLASTAVALRDGNDTRTGLSLALLLMKPNLAALALPFLVLQRRWRALYAMTLGGVALVMVALPWGLTPWQAFLDAVRGVADRQEAGNAPIEKQFTVHAFLRMVLGAHDRAAPLVWLLWLLIIGPLTLLAARAWRQHRNPASSLRLVGSVALFLVCANPRLYFYDALILLVPAAGWYLHSESYTSVRLRRVIGALVAAIVWSGFAFIWVPPIGCVIGPLTAAWLALESVDLSRAAYREAVAPAVVEAANGA